MPHRKPYYHLVWATKWPQPLITPDIEPMIYGFVRAKAVGLGAIVYAIGGIEDHVPMAVSIPPKISVSTFVGQAKGIA